MDMHKLNVWLSMSMLGNPPADPIAEAASDETAADVAGVAVPRTVGTTMTAASGWVASDESMVSALTTMACVEGCTRDGIDSSHWRKTLT